MYFKLKFVFFFLFQIKMSSKIPSVKVTLSRGVIERKKRSQVMCRDKVCFLDFVVVPDCYVYLYTNDTNCDIPCQVSGCQKELHHFISCPIWTCNDLTTTLSTFICRLIYITLTAPTLLAKSKKQKHHQMWLMCT